MEKQPRKTEVQENEQIPQKSAPAPQILRFQPIFPVGPPNTGDHPFSLKLQMNTHCFVNQKSVNKRGLSTRNKDDQLMLSEQPSTETKNSTENQQNTPNLTAISKIAKNQQFLNKCPPGRSRAPSFTPVCLEYYLFQKELKESHSASNKLASESHTTIDSPKASDDSCSSFLAAAKRRLLRNQPKFAAIREVTGLFDLPVLQLPSPTLIVTSKGFHKPPKIAKIIRQFVQSAASHFHAKLA